MSAGSGYSCALRADDTIACWGSNLGGKSDAPNSFFRAINGRGTAICGTRNDNTLRCWGVGLENSRSSGFVHGYSYGYMSYREVTYGSFFGCGLQTDDSIRCWGRRVQSGDFGQTVDLERDQNDRVMDRGLMLREGFKSITAGRRHFCGLRTDSTVTCWLSSSANRDGYDYGQDEASNGHFTAISAGAWHSCGLRTDDTVTCWGNNADNRTDAPAGRFKSVSAGTVHSCGLRTDDTVTCWGNNDYGQTDAPDGHFKVVEADAGGAHHSCGLRNDGMIICWGTLPLHVFAGGGA